MGNRRKAREIAVQILYRMDINPCALEKAWDELESCGEIPVDNQDFTHRLLQGTMEKLPEIDKLISNASIKWDISRMAVVDRNILRLATFELLSKEDVPARVVLNEAIELAKNFGGEESGTFVNGVLDRIRVDIGRNT